MDCEDSITLILVVMIMIVALGCIAEAVVRI